MVTALFSRNNGSGQYRTSHRHTHMQVVFEGRGLGVVVVERRLNELAQLVADLIHLDPAGEIVRQTDKRLSLANLFDDAEK